MKKYIGLVSIALATILVAGCEKGSRESTFQPYLTGSLKDCTATEVSDGSGNSIDVIRCPASTTTTYEKIGKTTQTTVVFEPANNDVPATRQKTDFQIEKSDIPIAEQVAPDKVVIDGVEYFKK